MNKTIKTQHNKKALLEAMEKCLGVITTACKIVGLNRSTFYDYYNNDPEFKKQADDIENVVLDFAESQLHKQIKDGNPSSTIFFLKTKGKNRGYFEKTLNENINSGQLEIKVSKKLNDALSDEE
tara:strand:- start:538 stop:909 length:372 start_codon:yes stop_codon:yes gene_type:complete